MSQNRAKLIRGVGVQRVITLGRKNEVMTGVKVKVGFWNADNVQFLTRGTWVVPRECVYFVISQSSVHFRSAYFSVHMLRQLKKCFSCLLIIRAQAVFSCLSLSRSWDYRHILSCYSAIKTNSKYTNRKSPTFNKDGPGRVGWYMPVYFSRL